MHDEKDLIQKCKNHDFKAFEELVHLYENMVYSLANRVLMNTEDAQDVLQDTFYNVYKSLGSFRSEAKFSTWLYRITYNLCLAKIKKRSKASVDIQDAVFEKIQAKSLHDWSVNVEDVLVSRELSSTLKKAIARLPQQNRAVFILRDVEGYTTQEVSDITSLSISAVKSRLHRARLKLRSLLSQFSKSQPVAQ